MRTLAMTLSAAAAGAALVVTLAYAIRLRWRQSGEFGWHLMAGMASGAFFLAALRYQYTDGPGRDLVMVIALLVILALFAWRLALILREPPKR